MLDNNQNIMLLRTLSEEAAGHRVSTSTDFTFLSGCIQGRLKETLSVSTLERVWGYVEGYRNIRESTLDVLSRFVGYPDWKTFVADYCEVPSAQTSHRILAPTLTADEVPTGKNVVIEWVPGRRVILRHEGDGCWQVMESERSKLAVGDRFRCHRFTLNQPLYLEDLQQIEAPSNLFVVGCKGGLTRAEVLDVES